MLGSGSACLNVAQGAQVARVVVGVLGLTRIVLRKCAMGLRRRIGVLRTQRKVLGVLGNECAVLGNLG